MKSRSENIAIWKIEKRLEEIKELLKIDYSVIDDELCNLSIEIAEKTFNHRWDDSDNLKIENIEINGVNSRVIYTKAIIEVNKVPNINKIRGADGKPLMKCDRVIQQISSVMFVESLGSVYAIVNGPKTIEAKIRRILMDQKNKQDSIWGKIYVKDVGIYKFDKCFYRWLITQNNNTLIDNELMLRINDVSGFKSNGDRRSNNFSGEGSNIHEEIPFKSIISLDENISTLHIDLIVNNRMSYNFAIESDGRLKLCSTLCGEFLVHNPKIYDLHEIILNIYFLIIPTLVKKYNEDILNGWAKKDNELKGLCSKEIIKTLSKLFGYTKSDLEKIL
ncbi:hypothetical protein [Clostridium sp.]|uniref:hypothetical protein n=1 Tax=Clostridium sp. TaxID=1506 RepID=UPI0029134F70|nr:hypothetical protein [Clostridium sp.]MDU6522120.1 hypothetical protein [Clostridium sp.]